MQEEQGRLLLFDLVHIHICETNSRIYRNEKKNVRNHSYCCKNQWKWNVCREKTRRENWSGTRQRPSPSRSEPISSRGPAPQVTYLPAFNTSRPSFANISLPCGLFLCPEEVLTVPSLRYFTIDCFDRHEKTKWSRIQPFCQPGLCLLSASMGCTCFLSSMHFLFSSKGKEDPESERLELPAKQESLNLKRHLSKSTPKKE